MVKRVAAPAEHYLITQGSNLVTQFGGETLTKFSLQKLLEHRLTNRNLKAGLDFTDPYKSGKAIERYLKMIETYVKKEFAFLYKDGVTSNTFLEHPYHRTNSLQIRTFYDQSVERYVNKLNTQLVIHGIPMTIRSHPYNTVEMDLLDIRIEISHSRSQLNYYKLIFFTPQVLQVFKNLARKAKFTDTDAIAISRSKHSGFITDVRAQRDARSEGSATTAANPAPNSRRPRAANRPAGRTTA